MRRDWQTIIYIRGLLNGIDVGQGRHDTSGRAQLRYRNARDIELPGASGYATATNALISKPTIPQFQMVPEEHLAEAA